MKGKSDTGHSFRFPRILTAQPTSEQRLATLRFILAYSLSRKCFNVYGIGANDDVVASVYVDGNYPDEVRRTIPTKFLPNFTAQEQALIK